MTTIRRLLCAIGLHQGWHDVGRCPTDLLGITTVYQRCNCDTGFREVWDFGDGQRRVLR